MSNGSYKLTVWYNGRIVHQERRTRKTDIIRSGYRFVDVFKILQGEGMACDWRVRLTNIDPGALEVLYDITDHDRVEKCYEVEARLIGVRV